MIVLQHFGFHIQHIFKTISVFGSPAFVMTAHICSSSNRFNFVHDHPPLQASQPDELTIEEHEVLEVIEDGDMEDWVKVYSFAHIAPSCDIFRSVLALVVPCPDCAHRPVLSRVFSSGSK